MGGDLHKQARRIETGVAAWVASAPGTYTYLFVLLVTSWSLRGVDPRLADRLIRAQSTNLDNLSDRPFQVLVASAFWTSGSALPWQLLLRFTVVLAPVERRLGTRRWLFVFAAGHVVATILTVAGIGVGLRHGALDFRLAHASDVGVSYGLYAVAGAMTPLLTPRIWRPVWLLALTVSIAAGAVSDITFTDVGHVLALVAGVLAWPLVLRWQQRPLPRAARGGSPIVVPPVAARRGWQRLRRPGAALAVPRPTPPQR